MNLFLVFVLIGLCVLGLIHGVRAAYRVGKGSYSAEYAIRHGKITPLEVVCVTIFVGPLVLLVALIQRIISIFKSR